MLKTGWFGIPMKPGKTTNKYTMTHIVSSANLPICGYKPNSKMQFQWCANGIRTEYVECTKCKEKAPSAFYVSSFYPTTKSQKRFYCVFENNPFNLNLKDVVKGHSKSFETEDEAIKHGMKCRRLFNTFMNKVNKDPSLKQTILPIKKQIIKIKKHFSIVK